ncbi:hypothetical protein NPIL_12131 [Nephila pilipes]|uniref:Uncharacterized protein n=1 Tax=Nephila pilipes TaxID=299642 RepID=A0A8X6QT41_NEPPI|nr:hypothetical protein NPIL_12131 [Nephila pilipes]
MYCLLSVFSERKIHNSSPLEVIREGRSNRRGILQGRKGSSLNSGLGRHLMCCDMFVQPETKTLTLAIHPRVYSNTGCISTNSTVGRWSSKTAEGPVSAPASRTHAHA